MRALVVAPHPFFSPRGTPFSVYYRTLITAEQGVEVDLLTYWEGQEVAIPGVRVIRIPWVPLTANVPVGPSLKKLVLDLLMFVWTVGLLLRKRYDFVHAHEESVFFCSWLKPIFGFKLVYDMHSSLPQQLSNFEFTKSRLAIRVFERLEKASLRSATAVVTICPDLAEQVESQLSDTSRHFLIENSIFENVKLASGSPPSAAEAEIVKLVPGAPLVVYSGTFEAYQGLDVLIQAFAQVHQSRPDASLLLVGGTPEQVDRYQALADSHGLNGGCQFTGRVPQATARSLSQRATVLTSPRVKGTNTPLKIYEQLASGIPLVATRIHSHTQVLDDDVCFLVEPTAAGLAGGILQAITDSEKREAVTRGALELYDRRYSRRVYEQKMHNLLGRLRVNAVADRGVIGVLDDLVDGLHGYALTCLILALLVPVVMIRPVLMLLTHVSSDTVMSVRLWLARRRMATAVMAE
jgi:glycosyltransferase involved in cell wall biosynthesis